MSGRAVKTARAKIAEAKIAEAKIASVDLDRPTAAVHQIGEHGAGAGLSIAQCAGYTLTGSPFLT